MNKLLFLLMSLLVLLPPPEKRIAVLHSCDTIKYFWHDNEGNAGIGVIQSQCQDKFISIGMQVDVKRMHDGQWSDTERMWVDTEIEETDSIPHLILYDYGLVFVLSSTKVIAQDTFIPLILTSKGE